MENYKFFNDKNQLVFRKKQTLPIVFIPDDYYLNIGIYGRGPKDSFRKAAETPP